MTAVVEDGDEVERSWKVLLVTTENKPVVIL